MPTQKDSIAQRNIASNLSTRERILAYLQENHVASVHALSRAWGLTRANIRYHFKTLVDEGVVELIPRATDLPAPRGRPAQSYRLTAQSVPGNFPHLCEALIDVLLANVTAENQAAALQEVSRRLADGMQAGAKQTGSSPIQRLNQAVSHLNQHGYKARWEAYASGPRISLHNCPYAAILSRHPELCEVDRQLLIRLAGGDFQQIARQNLATGHPAACIFAYRVLER